MDEKTGVFLCGERSYVLRQRHEVLFGDGREVEFMLRIVRQHEVVCKLVCDAKVDGNEGIYKAICLNVRVVPCEIVAQIEEDRSASIEGNRWALGITEHVHALRIHAKDGPDWAIHELNEALKSRAVMGEGGGSVEIRAHVHFHAHYVPGETEIHVHAIDVAVRRCSLAHIARL